MYEDKYLENHKELIKVINQIAQLSKGSLQPHIRNNVTYYYLANREGKSVKREYIGREDDPKIEKIKKEIEERRRLESYLLKLKNDEKKILSDEKKRLITYQRKMQELYRSRK